MKKKKKKKGGSELVKLKMKEYVDKSVKFQLLVNQ